MDKFTSYLKVKESLNDNIFLTFEDERDDLISELSAGIKFGDLTNRKKTNLFAEAGVISRHYAELDEYNVENPYFDLSLRHGLGRLSLNLEYSFIMNQASFTDLSLTASGGFVDYFKHSPRLEFNIDLNRFLLELAYSYDVTAYDEGDFRTSSSYKEDTVSLAGLMKVFPKTYAFLEYDRRWKGYYKGGPAERYHDEYWLGVRGKISPKIQGLIKFGYEQGYFPQEDKSSSAVNIKLNYRISRRLICNLEVERGVGVSSVSTDELDLNQYFGLGFVYRPPFNKKLRLKARVSLDSDEYQSGREDKKYSFSLSSQYNLNKWFTIAGEYVFRQKTSDAVSAEYENKIMSLKLTTKF